jgi:hypothetical protein
MVEFYPNTNNFIKTMISHPCARPWYVWVETFFPAVIELAFMVVLFDVEDALRAHGEKIVREGGRRPMRGGRHAPRIRQTVRETKAQKYTRLGLKTLLVVTKPIELIGFVWLLYGATDRFFYNWQTLMELSDFCTQPIVSGPMQRSRGPGFIGILPGGAVTPMTVGEQNRGSWPNNEFGVTLPQGQFTAFFALTVTAPLFGVNDVRVRLRISRITGTFFIEGDPVDLKWSEVSDLLVNADFFLPTVAGGSMTWELVGQGVPAGIFCSKGHVMAMRTG